MDTAHYIALLQDLIKIHSLSGQETGTADILTDFLANQKIPIQRVKNNIVARSKYFNPELPTIVLNSHHDTVAIGSGWTRDPLGAEIDDGILYGRGANDAGGALVALIATFVHFYEVSFDHFNLMLIASGEEENFGPNGVSAVLDKIDIKPALAIVGEPTNMHLGIAEKGLIVIDAKTKGVSGHAAREEGHNALYDAAADIEAIKKLVWDRISPVLGPTMSTVTQITSGTQHNVIPDECHYVIDCRVNELYTLEEVVRTLDQLTHAELSPRSLRWIPSGIDINHPIVASAKVLSRDTFGSPTLSDQVHFTCPSVKIGPGYSERSHTADEYILVSEIEEGIKIYIDLLRDLDISNPSI